MGLKNKKNMVFASEICIFQEKVVLLQPEVVFYLLNYFYILQILNQEHPIQPILQNALQTR